MRVADVAKKVEWTRTVNQVFGVGRYTSFFAESLY